MSKKTDNYSFPDKLETSERNQINRMERRTNPSSHARPVKSYGATKRNDNPTRGSDDRKIESPHHLPVAQENETNPLSQAEPRISLDSYISNMEYSDYSFLNDASINASSWSEISQDSRSIISAVSSDDMIFSYDHFQFDAAENETNLLPQPGSRISPHHCSATLEACSDERRKPLEHCLSDATENELQAGPRISQDDPIRSSKPVAVICDRITAIAEATDAHSKGDGNRNLGAVSRNLSSNNSAMPKPFLNLHSVQRKEGADMTNCEHGFEIYNVIFVMEAVITMLFTCPKFHGVRNLPVVNDLLSDLLSEQLGVPKNSSLVQCNSVQITDIEKSVDLMATKLKKLRRVLEKFTNILLNCSEY